jgi:choline dehydrogenase-like flavoprotein
MKSDKQLAALRAICNAFIPSIVREHDEGGYWRRNAADNGVPERILALVSGLKAEDKVQFEQLMDLISSPMLGLTWFGPLRSADRLTTRQIEKMLQRWAASPLPLLRNAFQNLRKLTTLIYFGDVPDGSTANPSWQSIGYAPEDAYIRPDESPLPLFEVGDASELYCEVLVIGSGAGGSIVAATLAAAGQDVLIVEKGGYAPKQAFTQQEFPMIQRHFEAGGLLASKDGGMTILAGSGVGGGTTINWAGCLRTPDFVLEEWGRTHGNPQFLEKDYARAFEAIEKRNSVSDQWAHNPQNAALWNAAQALGQDVGNIPMNLKMPSTMPPDAAWRATGFSCIGDAYAIKQGAVQTFLRDALEHGAKLLPNSTVQRVTTRSGVATGAEILHDGHKIRIHAKRVVVAAGALHTPVILKKSGLCHSQIGKNLFLHPVATVAALHEQDTLPWQGPMMSVVVREFARLHEGWGVRIECPPIHPGLGASALAWTGGEAFKAEMLELRRTAVNLCLTRDRFGGEVSVGKQSGQPVVDYKLSEYDKKHLVRGLQEAVRLHAAAGAERVTVLHNQPLHFFPKKDKLSAFLTSVERHNWGVNRFGLFSAHQMGTCRMGGSKDYPVKPNGETREVRNLYVADASLFPSASGTNPMLSIQAMVWHLAQGLIT